MYDAFADIAFDIVGSVSEAPVQVLQRCHIEGSDAVYMLARQLSLDHQRRSSLAVYVPHHSVHLVCHFLMQIPATDDEAS